ncbi:MAG: hypothetical protein J2P45_25175, partial [Candidatus Dormibacteraeota bacterium]|nr:hypothetical protein [Candidatus Dormibacteraeota bacterium]
SRNRRDLAEVPQEARDALEWRFVDQADQVLEVVLKDQAVAA